MLRKNFLNGLLAVAGLGLLLVGYNSFVAKQDSKTGNTVAGKFGSYLKLEQTKSDAPDGQIAEVTTPEVETGEVMVKDETATTEETSAVETSAVLTPVVETPVSPEVMKKDETPAVVAPATVTADAKAASTYTVKEGDTYGCIAEKYYGSFENWLDVDSANPNTEGFLERRLFVGTTLTLPALTTDQVKPASTLCS